MKIFAIFFAIGWVAMKIALMPFKILAGLMGL